MSRISGSVPKPRLDIRDLELLVALAAAGTTVRAASTLHITQSAISRGLLLAEEKLGTRIFERTSRGLVPTAAGEALLEGATPLLAQLVALEARVVAPAATRAPLRLVCECYTAYRWLPSTLSRLKDTSVALDIEHTRTPVTALVDGLIDVALLTTASLPPRSGARFAERPLFGDEIIFLVSEDHPLAARPALALEDLLAYPLIGSTLTPDAERKWFFQRAFGKRPPAFTLPPLRLPLTEAMIDTARAGMGIAILSEWIASPYLEGKSGLVVKRLQDKAIVRPWRIAYRREVAESALRLAAAIEHAPPRVYVMAGGNRDATPSARRAQATKPASASAKS